MKTLVFGVVTFIGVAVQAATLTTSPITGAGYPSTLPQEEWITDDSGQTRWWITSAVAGGTVAEIRNSNLFGSDNIGTQAFYFRGSGTGAWVYAAFDFGGYLNAGETVSFDVISAWGDGFREIRFGWLGLGDYHFLGNGLNLVDGSDNPLYGDTYQRAFSFELKALVGNDYSIRVFNKTPSESNPAWENTRTVNKPTGMIGGVEFVVGGLWTIDDDGNTVYPFDTGGAQAANIDNTGFFVNNISITPEPSTPMLMGLGLAGLAILRRTRKNA